MAEPNLRADPDYLHILIASGDLEQAEALLKGGWPVDRPNQLGETPLWLASESGELELVQLLLQHGADPNLPDAEGKPPILAAFKAFAGEVVDELLDAEADASMLGEPRCVQLALAAMTGDVDTLAELLDAGHDINCSVTGGRTALLCAVGADQPESVRLLLDRGADVEIAEDAKEGRGGEDGARPVHYAVSYGGLEVLQLLLDAGANPDAAFGEGRTALAECAFQCDVDKAAALLDAGANVLGATYDGLYRESPLAISAWKGCTDCVRLFLEYGAADDEFTLQFAFREAFAEGGREIVQLLQEAGAEIGLFEAVAMRSAERVLQLLNNGSDVNERDFLGDTPLLFALRRRPAAIQEPEGEVFEETLLREGADVNARGGDGETAMSIVAKDKSPYYRDLLRHYGVDEGGQ